MDSRSCGKTLVAEGRAGTQRRPLGLAVALIFFLRMRIESAVGKSGTRQAAAAGFETEDVLYLLPIVTLSNGIAPFLTAAAIGAPLFAVLVAIDYWRVMRKVRTARANIQGTR